jgi:hypothetical protein
MTGLQEAFYIIAIVYMGVSFLIILVVLAALLVIRHKIVSLERMVRDKIDAVTSMGARAGEVISTVKKFAKRAAK